MFGARVLHTGVLVSFDSLVAADLFVACDLLLGVRREERVLAEDEDEDVEDEAGVLLTADWLRLLLKSSKLLSLLGG